MAREFFQSLKDFDDLRPYLEADMDKTFPIPEFVAKFDMVLIVDGLPLVNQEKRAKLLGIVFKLYSQFASYLVEKDDIYMPEDAKGISLGFCYVRFKNAEDAKKAMEKTQGFALSKSNSFKVSLYSELIECANITEEYRPPADEEFVPPQNPCEWLCDAQGRDQFVLRHGRDTEIFWANTTTGEEPARVYGGEREKEQGKVWCERQVSFSPQGTYLATYHPQGIKLWGCAQFESQGRFLHENVETMEFSPCENYIVTYSSNPFARDRAPANNAPAENIIVWDVENAKKLRSFPYKSATDVKMQVQATVTEDAKGGRRVDRSFRGRVSAYDERSETFTITEGSVVHNNVPKAKVQALQNPNVLKWSNDGRYVARLAADAISVYEVPSMQLLDKKSFAAKDMLNFCWAPKQNLLSYWSPTAGNYPAMINVVSVERKEICSRKCFDILEGHMLWQSEGDYLCVHMTKQQGKKRSYVVMFFRVKEPGVPVELIELTDPVVNVSWEPSGERVAIVHGEAKSATITFYSMVTSKKSSGGMVQHKELSQLFALSNQQCTAVQWSPAGGVCAIAYFVSGDSCVFQLYDADMNTVLASRRHERCTGLYWDPSGRIIASVTCSPMINGNIIRGAPLQVDDSYNLWTFQGAPICVVRREKLYQFIWRPRPVDLLTLEERRAVIKNLKKYEKIFEREDKVRKAEIYQENTAKRNAIAASFLQLLANRKRELCERVGEDWRVIARDGYDENDSSNYEIVVQTEEIVLNTKEHVITSN